MSDDPLLGERGDALVGVADTGEDLAVVLADVGAGLRRRPGVPLSRGTTACMGTCPSPRRAPPPRCALLDVGILEELADVVHGRRRDLGALEERDRLGQRARLMNPPTMVSTSSRRFAPVLVLRRDPGSGRRGRWHGRASPSCAWVEAEMATQPPSLVA